MLFLLRAGRVFLFDCSIPASEIASAAPEFSPASDWQVPQAVPFLM
jgi:hypothetical protein